MAGQDIKKRLLPGQSQPVQVGGDFIFVKFADRPVTIIINGGESSGSRVILEAGDKYRPGSFTAFEIENTDNEKPAQIILTVGRGDYTRQIVTGQIYTTPVLQKADGSTVSDTRKDDCVILSTAGIDSRSYVAGEIMDEKATPETQIDPNRTPVVFNNKIEFFESSFSQSISGGGVLAAYVWSLSPVAFQGVRYQPRFELIKNSSGQELYPIKMVGVKKTGSFYGYTTEDFPHVGVYSDSKALKRSFRVEETDGVITGTPGADLDGNFIVTAEQPDNTVRLITYSEYGTRLRAVSIPLSRVSYGVLYIRRDLALVTGASSKRYWINPETGENLGLIDAALNTAMSQNSIFESSAVYNENENAIIAYNRPAKKIVKVAIEDFYSPGKLVIYQGGESVNKTQAYTLRGKQDIYQGDGSKTVVSGELIGQIVGYLFGSVPDNYMDCVYKVDIAGQEKISGGYSSLAAVGIEDAIKIELPAAVKITTDKDITE